MWPLKRIEDRLDQIEHTLCGDPLSGGLVDEVRKLKHREEMRALGPRSRRPTSDWDVSDEPSKSLFQQGDWSPPEDAIQPGVQTMSLLSVEITNTTRNHRPLLRLRLEDNEGRKGFAFIPFEHPGP